MPNHEDRRRSMAYDLRTGTWGVHVRETAPSPVGEQDDLVWECGPHANAWNGHDARCRRVAREGRGGEEDAP